MSDSATHRFVKTPRINSRYLSDFMVASEIRRRSIIRDCKYPKIARAIQHNQAKAFITNALRSGTGASKAFEDEGQRLLDAMADTDFDRLTLDYNGDFLKAYGEAFNLDTFPKTAELVDAPPQIKVTVNGVRLNPDIRFGVQRVKRTNRLRTGIVHDQIRKRKAT